MMYLGISIFTVETDMCQIIWNILHLRNGTKHVGGIF